MKDLGTELCASALLLLGSITFFIGAILFVPISAVAKLLDYFKERKKNEF